MHTGNEIGLQQATETKLQQKIPFTHKADLMRNHKWPYRALQQPFQQGQRILISVMTTECTGSRWGVTWGKHDELIWNWEKVKYLLVSRRNPPETSQPYNSHREGQKTIAIHVSVGPGKINPHTELVLSAGCNSGTARYLTAQIKPGLSLSGKQGWFITCKVLLSSTRGKKKDHTVRIYSLRLQKAHSFLLTLTLLLLSGSSKTKNLNLPQ
jgi:hypothetical protein